MERRSFIVGLDFDFNVHNAKIEERTDGIVTFVEEHKVKLLAHMVWSIQDIAKKHPDSFFKNLRTNWKQMASFLSSNVYEQPLLFETRIFQTFTLYPVLKSLIGKLITKWVDIREIIANLSTTDLHVLESRLPGFQYAKEAMARVLYASLIRAASHKHLIDGTYYSLSMKKLYYSETANKADVKKMYINYINNKYLKDNINNNLVLTNNIYGSNLTDINYMFKFTKVEDVDEGYKINYLDNKIGLTNENLTYQVIK